MDFDINVTGTIADDSVTNAKLANVPQATIKGSPVGAGTVNPVDMTPDQASAVLDTATDPFVRTSDAVSAISPTENFIPRFNASGDLINTAMRVDAVAGGNPVWPGTLRIYAAGYSGYTLLDVIDGDVVLGNTSQQYAHFNDNYFAYKQPTGGPPLDLLYYHYTDGFFVRHNIRGGGNGRMIYTNGSFEVGIGDIDNVDAGTKVLVSVLLDQVDVKAGKIVLDAADIEMPLLGDGLLLNTSGQISEVPIGTGVATALGNNIGSAGSLVENGGALGTPASGNLANCTFPTLNQNTTGSAAQLTTARNIDGQAFNGTGDITVIAPGTHAATSKTTPVDADELPLVDSAASNVLKKLSWANIKATLKTYFDTLYQPIGQSPANAVYSNTPTFTAGAAPSGATNHSYNWTRIGNLVTYQITLSFATAGTTVTAFTAPLPAAMPNPIEQSGLTGASNRLAPLVGGAINTATGSITATTGALRRNSGDTAYEFGGALASGTFTHFYITGSYFTA